MSANMHFVVVAVACLAGLSACAGLPPALTEPERAAVAEAGGAADRLQDMLAQPGNEKIDSILIYRDGRLVFERYANGYGPDAPHDLRSATKAVTALLVGIAIDRGLIQSEEQSILDFFPERRADHPSFSAIRIKDLLSMSSGLESDDWAPASAGNEERMYAARSWVDFFFSLPVADRPGARFRYSTAGIVLLGELVKRASGMDFDRFADAYLFGPLGIGRYRFAKTPAGEIDAGGHAAMAPRDFAKIGLLVLQDGVWEGRRLLSADWVRKINQARVLVPGASVRGPYMGFCWWQEPVADGAALSFQARGNGGQYLIAVPGERLLGVFTGSAYNSADQTRPFALMQNYVIPAFKTAAPAAAGGSP